ncbi:MAG: hypothetical protein HKN67_11665 [Saprospiraceae bacterium]|nr:hypothetical protein [Saprospiraceae bacterium]
MSDINDLLDKRSCTSKTQLPEVPLIFSLAARAGENISLKISDHEYQFEIPNQLIDLLADDQQVGFEGYLSGNSAEGLLIKVEKDFKCLTERKEDESDLFKNPLSSH